MDLGADLTFNSIADSGYVRKLKEATNGGAHAAIVFSAAQRAYTDAPKILRYVSPPKAATHAKFGLEVYFREWSLG